MSKRLTQAIPKIMSVIAVAMALFQVLTAGFGTLATMEQRCIHVGFALVLIYLYAASRREKPDAAWVVDILCALAAAAIAVYVYFNWYDMAVRIMFPTAADLAVGAALIVLVIDATRRRVGWALPIITVIFLAYALFGHVLPGQLGHREYGWRQVIASLTMNTEGVFGTVVGVSATYIFLFVLFGTLLEYSGAARFFVDLSTGALGHRRGGTAIAAAVASGVFGMISGSPAANVMTTGSVTVPLMKKTGYQDDFAGAVEASASTGGQIMPPIMGAAAFIIAETLGLPYIQVTGVDHPLRQCVQFCLISQVICPQPDLYPLQHPLHHLRVAVHGDALVEGVEVVVVVGEPHRQPPDDERRQLRAGPAPLLGGVALHQLLVDVRAHQADGLFLQVPGLGDPCRRPLFLYLPLGLVRRHHAPHPVERVHIEGKVIYLAAVVGHRAVGVAVELGKLVYIIPYIPVVGMEDVGTVPVDLDALYVLCIDVAGDVVTPVDDQHLFAPVRHLPGEHRAI